MDSERTTISIKMLSNKTYSSWNQRIVHELAFKDFDDFIDDESLGRGSVTLNAWSTKDRKAQAIIGLTLPDELLENVREVKSAREMCTAIRNPFERHTLLNKLAVRRKFYTVTKEEFETVLQFASRIRQLASSLKFMKVRIDDSETDMALLNGLPKQYDSFISAPDAIGDEDEKLKFIHVKARTMQEEQRINMRHTDANVKAESAALLTQTEGTRRLRPKCRYCEKPGHSEYNFWKKHPYLNPCNTSEKIAAFVASDDGTEIICLMAIEEKRTSFTPISQPQIEGESYLKAI